MSMVEHTEFGVISVADHHLNPCVVGETLDPFGGQATMLRILYRYFLRVALRHRRR
jgi:hypothetical protein